MPEYRIVAADLRKDQQGILDVLAKNFPSFNPKRFQWLYLGNPFGLAKTWLVQENDSKRIVGCASLFPRKMIVNGREVLAGIAGDFAINKEIRGFNLAIRLQRKVISHSKREFVFLYGFPNKSSELLLQRVGYKTLGKLTRLGKPYKADQKLKEKISPLLARLASPCANFILKYFAPERRRMKEPGFKGKQLLLFDYRFDELWSRVFNKFYLVGFRDSIYLNWKYSQNPDQKYKIFALVDDKEDRIFGYVVYYTHNETCTIADVLSDHGPRTSDLLVGKFLLHLREVEKVNAISMTFFAPKEWVKYLERFWFYKREEENKFIVYLDESSFLREECFTPEKWYILEGDRDI